jgi:hypothetical protein
MNALFVGTSHIFKKDFFDKSVLSEIDMYPKRNQSICTLFYSRNYFSPISLQIFSANLPLYACFLTSYLQLSAKKLIKAGNKPYRDNSLRDRN